MPYSRDPQESEAERLAVALVTASLHRDQQAAGAAVHAAASGNPPVLLVLSAVAKLAADLLELWARAENRPPEAVWEGVCKHLAVGST